MLLFKRLANLKRDFLARLTDKRRAERFPVGPEFPLRATLNLAGSDNLGRIKQQERGSGRDWSGRLINFSASGLSVQLPSAAITVRGEPTLVALTIEMHRLQIPAEVAHFRVFPTHATCGLKMKFEDSVQETAYLQLLESVVLGATLKPVSTSSFGRNPPGLVREEYRSDSKAQLSAWRDMKSRALDSFELRMHDHLVRGEAARAGIEVYTRQESTAGKVACSAPGFSHSAGEHAEARRLFRWVAPNLSRTVASDIRKFVLGFAAHARSEWSKPPVRNGELRLR